MRLITGKSLSVLAFALSANRCHSCTKLSELVMLYFSSVHHSYKYSIKYVELLKEKPTWTVKQINRIYVNIIHEYLLVASI